MYNHLQNKYSIHTNVVGFKPLPQSYVRQYDVSHPSCDDVRVLDFVGYKTLVWVTLTCLRGIALVYMSVEAGVLHKQVCTDLFKVDKSHVAVVGINPGPGVE